MNYGFDFSSIGGAKERLKVWVEKPRYTNNYQTSGPQGNHLYIWYDHQPIPLVRKVRRKLARFGAIHSGYKRYIEPSGHIYNEFNPRIAVSTTYTSSYTLVVS